MTEPYRAKLFTLLDQARQGACAGIAAAIVLPDEPVIEVAAGHASLSSESPFISAMAVGIGSITKTLTAVVILQLIETGLFRLDQPIFDLLDPGIRALLPEAAPTTIAQLLTHTGGLASWEDDPKWMREGRGALIDPARVWREAETLAYVPHRKGASKAGAGVFHYANTNYTLLGLAIEAATGRSAAAELRARLIEPLGMGSAYLEGFEPPTASPQPRRYHYATDAFVEMPGISRHFPVVRDGLIDVTGSNLSPEWTAGGLVMSAGDLARFGQALRDGELLRPDTMALLTQWQAIPGETDMAGRPASMAVGRGLFRVEYPGLPALIGHGGDVLGSTAALWWTETPGPVLAIVANVGSMHAGSTRPPEAKSIAHDSAFARRVWTDLSRVTR